MQICDDCGLLTFIKGLVCLCFILVLGCVSQVCQKDEDKLIQRSWDIIDMKVFDRVVRKGASALPALFETILHADGDIMYRPGCGGEPKSLRYQAQWAVKLILCDDYVKKHPQYKGVSFTYADDSLSLIDWWAKWRYQVLNRQEYELPASMFAYRDDVHAQNVCKTDEFLSEAEHQYCRRKTFADSKCSNIADFLAGD